MREKTYPKHLRAEQAMGYVSKSNTLIRTKNHEKDAKY